jgi:hypothetical protein
VITPPASGLSFRTITSNPMMKRILRMHQASTRHNYSSAALVASMSLMVALLASAGEPPAKSSSAEPQRRAEVLDNAAVIELKGFGLGESVIVDKIKSSRCNFDVSLSGLKQLKAASVPDGVISAMLASRSGPTANGTAAAEQAADPDDPKSPHEAGIWLYAEEGGKAKMTKLEPSVYSQAKTGGGIFMAYGQTVKSRAVLGGAHAEIELTNRRPIVYFYFEKTQSGLSDTANSATSPNEFILAQFEVKSKDNQRTLVMGQMNAYSGNKSGTDSGAVRSIGFEKLAPGIYKVSPKEDLADGEYGFFYGGNSTMGAYGAGASGGKVFDFAIRGGPVTEPKAPAAEDKKEPKAKTNVFKKIFGKS